MLTVLITVLICIMGHLRGLRVGYKYSSKFRGFRGFVGFRGFRGLEGLEGLGGFRRFKA